MAAVQSSASPGTAAEPSSAGTKLVLVVGIALLDPGSSPSTPPRVLLAQRPQGKAHGGLWEFPGGKVEAGETPELALVRELEEELGVQVHVSDLKPLSFASHTYPTFHILMPLFACSKWTGHAQGMEGQAIAWATTEDIQSSVRDSHPQYTLTPADVPLVADVVRAMQEL